MDANLKREIIIDNYQTPFHKNGPRDETYLKVNMNNESCIDDITLYVKIANDTIIDIVYEIEACAISTATTSIMSKLLIGKTITEAKQIVANYEAMINEASYDETLLKEANAFSDIAVQPNRKKCALLSWWGIKEIINKQ